MAVNREVVIIGGGVAGLTAAHELKERGFKVTVYEAGNAFGGKARSSVVGADKPDIEGLPAEHGFRFFGGFYKHVIDTMARIPCSGRADGRYVIDHLVDIDNAAYAREGSALFQIPTRVRRTVGAWVRALEAMFDNPSLGLGPGEAAFAAYKLIDAFVMCQARREAELDCISWSKYMCADEMSEAYRSVVVNGLTQNFVAMDAEKSSTKSVINILVRLFNDYLSGHTIDRILNGPTSEQWIDHWVQYLASNAHHNPVYFQRGAKVTRLLFEAKTNRIMGLEINGKPHPREEAQFIAAIPLEMMIELLANSPQEIQEHAPSLKLINDRTLQVNWMSGVMFYLRRDVPIYPGHMVFLDSGWALTGISQNQFWHKKVEEYSGGKIQGILSVIISDWFKPGNGGAFPGQAQAADNESQVADEALAEVRANLTEVRDVDLSQANVVDHFLDPDIRFGGPGGNPLLGLMPAVDFVQRRRSEARIFKVEQNAEPLFINTVNSWSYRPREKTEITNLFLAADYVKTATDLATMEGANEAGRRAVNALLQTLRLRDKQCTIFEFDEPLVFAPFRAFDHLCFELGLPHLSFARGGRLPYPLRALRDLSACLFGRSEPPGSRDRFGGTMSLRSRSKSRPLRTRRGSRPPRPYKRPKS